MADRSTPPNRKLNWGTVSRNLVFWMLIVLVPIAFYQMVGAGREQYLDVTYTTFNAELDRGNIERVEITNGKHVRGVFKQPVAVQGRKVDRFRLVLPVQDSEIFVQRLEQANVLIDAKEPKPSFGTVFLQLLPWVILIGLWLFFFRQVQQGGNRAFAFGKSKA
jgi:cell division protease FtsH